MSGETVTATETTATETQATSVLSTATAGEAPATEAKAADTGTETKAAAETVENKDGKAAEADADKPIEYQDFKLPEGVQMDEATLGEAKTLFAGEKLPQETAQKLVDFYAAKTKAFTDAQTKAWADLQETWKGEFKADKDIGGDRANDTISAAGKAIDRFGSPALREALDMTGAGNHPAVIRFVAAVGKAISEDKLVLAGGPSAAEKSAAETLYPDQNKAG